MIDNFAQGSGLVPEPQGTALGELGENLDAFGAGLVPKPLGNGRGTVASTGDRTPFVVMQKPALAGFKFITKGPGYLIAGAGQDSQQVFLIDATGFRSIRIESASVVLDGEIMALASSATHIFALVLDRQVLKRRLYVLENQSGVAVVATFEIDGDELATWIALNEKAGLVAYPSGVGRLEIRRINTPFAILSGSPSIGRAAVAHWFAFPSKEREGSVPIQPPIDYQNLWDFSSLAGLAQDYAGTETLDDVGPEGIDMTFGFAVPMRVTIGASMPDGNSGAVFSTKFSSLEPAYFERAHIDFAADGAFTLFGFVDAVDARRTSDADYIILAQGAAATGLRLFKEVIYNAGSPTYKIKFQTSFDSGMETLEYVTSVRELMSIAITQSATRAELWINGVLEDSVEPGGASAITIPNGDLFTLGGAEFGSSAEIDTHGILGQLWKRYDRVISGPEINAIIATATNTNEVGMLADYYFSNVTLSWDYSPAGKTWRPTNRASPAGGGGTAFVKSTSGLKLEFQMLFGGAGSYAGMFTGFRSNNVSDFGNPVSKANGIIVSGAGNVTHNGSTLGNIGAFASGDLVGCRVDLTTLPATFEFRKNNGSWTAFQVDIFSTFPDFFMLVYAGQLLNNMTGTTMQMLATVAEMAASGEIISAGYSQFPTVGG